jgi:hypothetical protein
MQTVTRFLRDNAEVIVSVCVVLSVVLGAALFYLTRLPVFDTPVATVVERRAAPDSAGMTTAPAETDEAQDIDTDDSTTPPAEEDEAEPDAATTHSAGGDSDPNRP